MSYVVPPNPQAKQRPTSVTVAVGLMIGVLVAQLIDLVITNLPNPERDAAINAFLADHPELRGAAPGEDAATRLLGLAVPLVVIVGFGVLTFFVNRGNRPARVITWVLGGIGVLCLGCVQLSSAVLPTVLTSTAGSGDEQLETFKDFYQVVADHTPDWQEFLSTGLGILTLLALLLVIILLAVPSANEYFRREQQIWVPPTAPPGAGFPQYPPPATPQNPPYPPTPGQ